MTATDPPSPRPVDVVVIGAGQAGLSAAYHLRRRGFVPVGGATTCGGAEPGEGAGPGDRAEPGEQRDEPERTYVALDSEDADDFRAYIRGLDLRD